MALAIESHKVMYEIFREDASAGQYRVVYFTELDEHHREIEITEAMLEAGYSEQEIRMIMGENALKFLAANLPEK